MSIFQGAACWYCQWQYMKNSRKAHCPQSNEKTEQDIDFIPSPKEHPIKKKMWEYEIISPCLNNNMPKKDPSDLVKMQ